MLVTRQPELNFDCEIKTIGVGHGVEKNASASNL